MDINLITDIKTLLTTRELSRRTGISVGRLENYRTEKMLAQGLGPKFVKLGPGNKAPVRYRLADVIEWEQSLRTVEASTTAENARAAAERVA